MKLRNDKFVVAKEVQFNLKFPKNGPLKATFTFNKCISRYPLK